MEKILMIKLGALGDVLRTIPIAREIKSRFPDSEFTWITKPNAAGFLKRFDFIDAVLSTPPNSLETYDYLYNFDIETEALALATSLHARNKFGFYESGGYPAAYNLGAEYYLNTLFDDELKKQNRRTYQEMMFDAADLPVSGEPLAISLTESEKLHAIQFAQDHHLGDHVVGVHIGSSPRWPSKSWHEDNFIELILLLKKSGREVLLFAGHDDVEKQSRIVSVLKRENISIITNDPHNTLGEFAALLSLCENVVCNDSLALHLALGLGKKTVALFFCTSPDEVEGYGLLTKLVAPRLYEFFPEKSDQYDDELVKSISVKEVISALS